MRSKTPKRRSAWLITWEAVPSYRLKDIGRPRIVSILKPQLSSTTIAKVLPVLFASESRLTLTEKIGISFFRQQPDWLHKGRTGFSCGRNPYLWARQVRDLYVQSHDDAWDHQTLYWTEMPTFSEDPKTHRIVEASPAYTRSEDARFEEFWGDTGSASTAQA
jgi:hypothetical protein